MFLIIPKATSLCWWMTGLPAIRASLCRILWISKSRINTGHSVCYSLACWELGAQRLYQTPAPSSPEKSPLIGQCVLPTVSHSSLCPRFTTTWFSVCKGKSWLQTLPSFSCHYPCCNIQHRLCSARYLPGRGGRASPSDLEICGNPEQSGGGLCFETAALVTSDTPHWLPVNPSGEARPSTVPVKVWDETEAKVSSHKMNFQTTSPTNSAWRDGRN